MILFLLCVTAYFLGSIPFGVIMGKLLRIDIQKVGSGNIGAANAFRNLGAGPGALVLIGDALKGMIPLVIAKAVLPPDASARAFVLVGLCAILGHIYSCFLKFDGGKGVATTVGVFLFISWKATLSAFSLWGIVILITRFASLASLTASFALPFFMKIFRENVAYVIFSFCVFFLILYKHRTNVRRLLAGTETRFTFGRER